MNLERKVVAFKYMYIYGVIILRAFIGSQQNGEEGADVSHISLIPLPCNLLHHHYVAPVCDICYS